MVQDFCDLIECRLLQDIRWRARVRLEGGVFLIGKLIAFRVRYHCICN